MAKENPDSQEKKEIKNLYSTALNAWYKQMHSASPDAKFYVVGSGATPQKLRLGQWGGNYTYENARINHIMAAISEDRFMMPPSDIDILVPKELKEAAVQAADAVFKAQRIFLHIHTEALKNNKSYVELTNEVLQKGYPF